MVNAVLVWLSTGLHNRFSTHEERMRLKRNSTQECVKYGWSFRITKFVGELACSLS